jgi:hypothetical protein
MFQLVSTGLSSKPEFYFKAFARSLLIGNFRYLTIRHSQAQPGNENYDNKKGSCFHTGAFFVISYKSLITKLKLISRGQA